MQRSCAILLMLGACAAAHASQPVPRIELFANNLGFVIVTNQDDNQVQYDCEYSVAVQFADRTSTYLNGATSPAKGANNHQASIQNTSKPVSSASVTRWVCKPH
jgi:hypothetical protein